jgi:hypothetical protein
MEVVEKYHTQLLAAISTAERVSGVTVRDFLRDVEISCRLRKALSYYLEFGLERQVCVEEIDKDMLAKYRNAGRLTWEEFSKKREKYMRERLSWLEEQSF